MCRPGYHYNCFVATHTLGHMMHGYQMHELAIAVITGRAKVTYILHTNTFRYCIPSSRYVLCVSVRGQCINMYKKYAGQGNTKPQITQLFIFFLNVI